MRRLRWCWGTWLRLGYCDVGVWKRLHLENVSIPASPDMSSTCVYICDAS